MYSTYRVYNFFLGVVWTKMPEAGRVSQLSFAFSDVWRGLLVQKRLSRVDNPVWGQEEGSERRFSSS